MLLLVNTHKSPKTLATISLLPFYLYPYRILSRAAAVRLFATHERSPLQPVHDEVQSSALK
jgi:hypothetical protein